MFPLLHTALAAVVLLAVAGCSVNPVSGQNELALLSEEQEISIGRKEHPSILETYGRYGDAELQAYVQRVGEKLAAVSHRNDLIYRFTVLDSTEVNAFALPGGYIYITRGLLAYLNSEAELAAVLGHEIGHVTARHSVRQYSAAAAAGVGYTIGAILVPELRNRGAQDLFNIMGTAILRGYGRDHELEADRLGAEYLARAGYAPDAMLDVIRVLKNQELFERERAKAEGREPQVYHGVFATHPDNDTRLQEVIAAAHAIESRPVAPTDPRRFLSLLDGLTFGSGAKEGVLRGQRFFHQELDFALTFPDGWKVENAPDHLTATAPGESAILRLTVEDRNRRVSACDWLQSRVAGGVRSREPLTQSPLTGCSGSATVRTPYGTRDARVAVVYHGQRAYLFMAAAKNVYGAVREFLPTVRSFRPLTAEERHLAEPLRLKIIDAPAGSSFRSLAAGSRIPNHPEAQLRLLNGRYPSGEPHAGEPIKTVQ